MHTIFNNPFRVLNIPITASEREIAKQINTLSVYAEMGKAKSFETDFPFFPDVARTPQIIEEAMKRIEQDENKFLYSLFWFWKNNSVDELALDLLKEGKVEKAIEIWEKSVFSNKNKVYKPIILYDNLIQQSNSWAELDNESHYLKKDNGIYKVERKKESSYSYPCVLADFSYNNNWSIECNTEWIDGADNIGYGIVFGRDDDFFSFNISANGYYSYDKNVKTAFDNLIPWKNCAIIKNWSSNHIKINKIDNLLSFFINDVLVDSFASEPFFGKYFGFIVHHNQKIIFSQFKFCKLIEDETYSEGINVSNKNYSSIKNLSTLYLSLATNNGILQLDYFNKGIAIAKSFFSSDNIDDFSKLIAGERHIYKSEKTLHFYINDVIDSLKNYLDKADGISTSQLIYAFSSFPVGARQFINNRFVANQIQNINKEIETAKTASKNSAAVATETGKKLAVNTKADIDYLKNILGDADYQYQTITDKLSLAIVQCGVDAFNLCKNDNGEIDYAVAIKGEEAYLNEYKYALSIAVTERAKERAKENLDSCIHFIENKHRYNCWFCGKNQPDKPSEYTETIYKVNHRSYFPRSVSYSYVDVNIPRCSRCYKIHEQNKYVLWISIIVFSILGIIIGAICDGHWFIGLLIGGAIGAGIGWVGRVMRTSRLGIKDEKGYSISDYPRVEELLKDGWQMNKPTA